MTIVIHTAEIKMSAHERIVIASPDKAGMLETARRWRSVYPMHRIRYRVIVEESAAAEGREEV